VWKTYVGKIRRFLGAIIGPNGAHAMLIKLGIICFPPLVEISLILLEKVSKFFISHFENTNLGCK
jgi:hypothetical protein